MELKRLICILLVVLGLGTVIVARQTNISQLPTSTTVDFTHVVHVDEKPPQQQTLRVAVAAMTSPHTTKQIYYDLANDLGEQLDMRVSFFQHHIQPRPRQLYSSRCQWNGCGCHS